MLPFAKMYRLMRYPMGSLILLHSVIIYAEPIKQLDTLQIHTQENPTGYANPKSSSATKFNLDELATPQSVQSVNAELLKDTQAQRIADVISLVSGVTALNPMGGLWDNYSIRGFNTDQTIGSASLRNGLNANLGLSASRDMVNIESIEFLKGPEAALYGAGDPGGTLNVITKKPQFSPIHQLSMRAGSYDHYRVALDSSNALSQNVAYRLGLAYEDQHSFRDFVEHQRLFIAPQLTWQLNERTQIDYDSEYSLTNSLFDRGVLAVNQQLGAIPQSRFLGEPKDGLMDMDDYLQQLRISHQFENGWDSQSSINFKDNSWRGYASEPYELLNAQGDLNRERRYRNNNSRSYLFNQDLSKEFTTGLLQHKFYLGVSASQLKIDNQLLRYRKKGATDSFINIYDPVYGVYFPALSPTIDTHEEQRNLGLSLSDYISISPQWAVLLGGRLDYYRQSYQDRLAQTSGEQSFSHFSPKIALNYRATPNWSIYSSVGQSFHLNSGLDRNSQAFDPEQAWTYELGSKWKLLNERLTASAALFYIVKDNVLTADPIDSAYYISAGEEKSRGFEVDLAAQPTDRLNFKLAYSYTDAYVSQSASADIAEGARLLNSPKHSANLFANYALWQKDLQKIAIGGNWQYVSARSANTQDNGLELPSYSLVNLNAYYEINPDIRLQFSLNNLFNKRYYSSSLKDLWITPGNPREFYVSLDYRF